jgi:hypothetical protein
VPGELVLGLDDFGVRVFRAVARQPGSGVDEVARLTGLPGEVVAAEVRHQHDLDLLRPSGRGWTACDPVGALRAAQAGRDVATAEERQALRDERTALARAGLFADYLVGQASLRGRDEVLGVLHGAHVRARLRELAESARADLRALVDAVPAPGGAIDSELLDAMVRAAGRGVRVSAVFTASALAGIRTDARGNPIPAPDWVRQRTHVPMRALVADHAAAVVPVDPVNLGRGAIVVTVPELVAVVDQLIDDLYATARPPDQQPPATTALSVADQAREYLASRPRARAIVGLLARGHGDSAIAAMLGVHRRTVHRDIDELMTHLGVRSRFALGVALADMDLTE